MFKKVKPIPDGFHTITPALTIRGANQAIDFYKKAFGAEELYRLPAPDGKLMHAEIRIGDSILMLGEERLEMGCKSPQSLNGSPSSLMLYCQDVDKAYQKAVDAGATVKMPLQDMFWGDRYCQLEDPFGHQWSIATRKENLKPEEMAERAKAAFAAAAKK